MKRSSLDLRLYWVEPDPDRERAADPLGLGGQADRIADRLLPGLSVNTRRARYLTFFCWAIRRSRERNNPLTSIHRLEAELACEEALGHWDSPKECPDIVGASRARTYLDTHERCPPNRPESLYKNMAFAAYRPLMRTLGLLAGGRRLDLTKEGEDLATKFQHARGPKPRCLGELSAVERTRLKVLLGLDNRAAELESDRKRRIRATYKELRGRLNAGLTSNKILETFATIPNNASQPAKALHQAFAWEALSVGLVLAFAMLLRESKISLVARRFRKVLSAPARWPGLRVLDPTDDSAALYVRGLLRRANELDPIALGLDAHPVDLARQLVEHNEIDGFLSGLLECHQQAKVADAWIVRDGGNLRILATKKNLDLIAEPRTYRIDAFAQLLRDLRLLS